MKRGWLVSAILLLLILFLTGCKIGVKSSEELDEKNFILETEKDFILGDMYDYAQQLGYNTFSNSKKTSYINGVASTSARFSTDNGFIDVIQQGDNKNKISYLSTIDKVDDVLVLSMFNRKQKIVLNLNINELANKENKDLKSVVGSAIEDLQNLEGLGGMDEEDVEETVEKVLGYDIDGLTDISPECVEKEIEKAVKDAELSEECLKCLNSLAEGGYDANCEDCYNKIRDAMQKGLENALKGACKTDKSYDMRPMGFITDPFVPLEGEGFELEISSASVGKDPVASYGASLNISKGGQTYFYKNGGGSEDTNYAEKYQMGDLNLKQGKYNIEYIITEVYSSPGLLEYEDELVTNEDKSNNRLRGTFLIGPPRPNKVIVSSTEINSSSVYLTWTQNQDSDFASYEVHMSREKRWFEPSASTLVASGKITSRTETSKLICGLNPLNTYYIRIRVVDINGVSADSDPITIKIQSVKPIAGFTPKITNEEAYNPIGFDMTCTSIPAQLGVSAFFADWGDGSIEQFPPMYFYNSMGIVMDHKHTYKNPGTYTAMVRCQDNHYIWSEWNSKQITIRPSTKPDLIIEKIEWNDTALTEKDNIIKIYVKNIGASKISQDFYIDLFYSSNDRDFYKFQQDPTKKITGGIEPGKTKSIYASFRQEQEGFYTIRAVADNQNNVVESRKDNNGLDVIIRVLETSKPVAEAEVLCSSLFYDQTKDLFMAIKGDNVCFKGGGEETGEYGDMIVKYMWDFDDDGNFDSVSNSGGVQFYTYKNSSLYKVRFVVEDNTGKTDEKTFDIRILDVYLKIDVKPSNDVDKDQDVEIKYTIYNDDEESIDVKSSGLEWDFDNGQGFRPEAIDSRKGDTGIVRSGETKVLWKKTTKAKYSGRWRANALVETQFGYAKASTIITVAGEGVVEIPGIVKFSSDKSSYSLGEKAILSVQTDISFAEFCDWYYRFDDNDWVLVPDRAYIVNGKASFTQTIDQDGYYLKDIGLYEAYALCSNKDIQLKESNRINFNVNSNTYKLSTNKNKYKKEQVYHSEDPIIFSIDTNVRNIHCFVNMLDNQNPSGWRDVCSITTDENGDATCQTPDRWFMEIGTHSAKLVCDNGGESNKITIEIVSCPPNQTC